MFRTLLIANRGEIACRIARTARRLGIETVAVFSEADAHALHVQAADRAYPIGPAPARDSYLNIPRIIAAARGAGAEAIHPGYGFLSENPAFAEACAAAGIVFVGPPAVGDARDGLEIRGQGADGDDPACRCCPAITATARTPRSWRTRRRASAFPWSSRRSPAAAGAACGSSQSPAISPSALESARQEAASAFGDDRVLIERYLQRPRHIEVQVFADTHGNAVHLFERDCSVQRRHQKVIEEAPAPGSVRGAAGAMGAAAVAAARAVGYVGAGTVEFVADADGFFFLEMNTRLQVEHPVTEMVTGFDLVEWQLRVAAGEALPATQYAITLTGHAIEARHLRRGSGAGFCSVDRAAGAFRTPVETDGVRVDTGFVTGDTVSIHYDAMLAKLICHGATREAALRRAAAGAGRLRRGRRRQQSRSARTHRRASGVRRGRHRYRLHRAPCRRRCWPRRARRRTTCWHRRAGGAGCGSVRRAAGSWRRSVACARSVVAERRAGARAGIHRRRNRLSGLGARDGAAWRIGDHSGNGATLDAGRLRVSLDGAWRSVTAALDQHVRDGARQRADVAADRCPTRSPRPRRRRKPAAGWSRRCRAR